MRLFVTARGNEELYVDARHDDPDDWHLAYPSAVEEALAASLSDAERSDILAQIEAAFAEERVWGDME